MPPASNGITPIAGPITNAVASLRGWTGIVLAAGPGTRMRSAVPKVLHPVAGVPMVRLVCNLLREAGCDQIVVVASPASYEDIADAVGEGVTTVVQAQPLGMGDATLAA
ncbi:MAG: NTP transferase domain-containing protein, partial [Dehalococcoidia bacterium]|nr:NTP transferase domain-containing protein [Dehalococcoidia bacterium]